MKAIFGKNSGADTGRKKNVMGAASSTFYGNDLHKDTELTVKLTCYLYANSGGQLFAAIERALNLTAQHRKNVRSLVGKCLEHLETLPQILRPIRNSAHCRRYEIFSRVCEISTRYKKSDISFIRRLMDIGQAMELSESEIIRFVERNGLAE